MPKADKLRLQKKEMLQVLPMEKVGVKELS